MVENGAGESTETPFNQNAPNQRPHCACLNHKHVSLQRPFLQDDTNTDYAPFDIADPTHYAALHKAIVQHVTTPLMYCTSTTPKTTKGMVDLDLTLVQPPSRQYRSTVL
jgi:hypothetical protein